MVTRYVVRDVRTRGIDYLAWGDDDPVGAETILAEMQALCGEDSVELVTMPAHAMDDHTRRIIDGADRSPWPLARARFNDASKRGSINDFARKGRFVNDRRPP